MHTEPKDPHGQDLQAIIKSLNLDNGEVRFSTMKMPATNLSNVYNLVDCTINISDAEGFGLSTLESLACETPIIVNMTGGLQEQVTDGENWFGEGIQPLSKAIIGSQDVPWIYEDRISKEQFLDAMLRFYNKSKEEREALGKAGRKHVLDNYGMDKFSALWVNTIEEAINTYGSWENRKGYKNWQLIEIK